MDALRCWKILITQCLFCCNSREHCPNLVLYFRKVLYQNPKLVFSKLVYLDFIMTDPHLMHNYDVMTCSRNFPDSNQWRTNMFWNSFRLTSKQAFKCRIFCWFMNLFELSKFTINVKYNLYIFIMLYYSNLMSFITVSGNNILYWNILEN